MVNRVFFIIVSFDMISVFISDFPKTNDWCLCFDCTTSISAKSVGLIDGRSCDIRRRESVLLLFEMLHVYELILFFFLKHQEQTCYICGNFDNVLNALLLVLGLLAVGSVILFVILLCYINVECTVL